MSSNGEQNDSWDRVAAELRACKDAQRRAYGDVDNATLGRYLAGDMNAAEAATLEQTLDELPELRKLADLVKDVLGDLEPVVEDEPAPVPVVLSLRAAPRRRRFAGRYAALAAAACVLFACLAALPRATTFAPRREVTVGAGFAELPRLGALEGRAASDARDAPLVADKKHEAFAMRAGPQAMPVPAPPRQVETVVANYFAKGDAVEAERTLQRQYRACYERDGADAANTWHARWLLADVYQSALNDQPAVEAKAAKVMESNHSGNRMRVELARRPAGEVVHVLTASLTKADDRQDRLKLVRALGAMGPAAKPAVPELCDRLAKGDDDERMAVLDALERMGPAAAEARPYLVKLSAPLAPAVMAKGHFAESRPATPKDRARQVLARLDGGARVGVYDAAGLFSVAQCEAASEELHRAALEASMAVRVETYRGVVPAATGQPVCLRIVIASGGKTVHVVAAPELSKRGIDPAELRRRLGKCGKDDQALAEVMAAVRKAKK